MKTSKLFKHAVVAVLVLSAFVGSAFADSLIHPGSQKKNGKRYKYVMVTGSHIPQKVEIKSIGTATESNLRVIGRREIDSSGRFTTKDVIALDPAVSTTGH